MLVICQSVMGPHRDQRPWLISFCLLAILISQEVFHSNLEKENSGEEISVEVIKGGRNSCASHVPHDDKPIIAIHLRL